jgi:hypothetical protein
MTYNNLDIARRRWLPLLAGLLFLFSLVPEAWQLKYTILIVVPWVYLLSGVPIYRPDGVLVFFYYLYAICYPTFLILSDEFYKIEILLTVTNAGYAALFFSFAVFSPRKHSGESISIDSRFNRFVGLVSEYAIPILISILFIITLSKGFETKRAINDSAGFVAIIKVSLMVLFVYASINVSHLLLVQGNAIRKILFFSLFGVVLAIGIGERDVFFRFCFVVTIFWFSVYQNFKTRYYVFGFVGLLVLLSISQQAKNFLLTGSLYDTGFSGLRWVFFNEFSAGSRNLYHVIINGKLLDSENLIINDLVRFVDVLNISESAQSATDWYNNKYRLDNDFSGTSGWGFGLIAELYYTFNRTGVFVGVFLVSSLTVLVYNKLWNTLIGRVLVLILYSAVIYSFRSDVANLLGLFFKWGVIAIGFAYFSYFLLFGSRGVHGRTTRL